MTTLHLDFETRSDVCLKTRGLDVYSADPSTRALMCSYNFDGGRTNLWTFEDGPFPVEVRDALADPHVEKYGFNSQFERVITNRVLKIKSPIKNWRCTMVLAYMQSFMGGLDMVGRQVGLPPDKQKMSEGKALIQLFCKPQKITKANPYLWRDSLTDPDRWELFGDYCIQDTDTEIAIKNRLIKYPVPEEEWLLYELDQAINDRGIPVDMKFVLHAIEMANRRKADLVAQMKEITRLANPMSPTQLLNWVRNRGYGFNDLGKDTVKKALKEQMDDLSPEAVAALKLRQQAARTSVKKYDAFVKACGSDRRFRFAFQFGGASRTNRWAGRRAQLQNLTRTPKDIEKLDHLTCVTDIIRDGDYDALGLYVSEPMNALAGCVRSSIRARPGKILRVCDLSSIESLVIAWLSGCTRLMKVFQDGLDPYKDFAQVLFNKTYDEVTKHERGLAKAPVLGCGYRLSGGELTEEGKKTGLWAYAENMGIDMSCDQSHEAVAVFRDTYPEIPQFWYALENATERALRTGRPQKVGHLTIEYMKPYLAIRLPSGRRMYYFQPRLTLEKRQARDGKIYEKKVFSYMGQDQVTKQWSRLPSHGGKTTEQTTQGTAREILKHGLLNAAADGFNIILHVHDEIGAEEDIDDDYHTVQRLRECMTAPIPWAPGLPLGAAGYENTFYIKD